MIAARLSGPCSTKSSPAVRAVITCAEGEWHGLPGHLATSVLRVRGFDADFIGPSVPADDLVGFLDPAPPPAVIVSCTTQMPLVGAWRTISTLRSLGTRVIAGGRGFGPTGSWTVAVGADDFADSFAAGADLLTACDSLPVPRAREPVSDPAAIADAESIHPNGETAVQAATPVGCQAMACDPQHTCGLPSDPG